MGDGRGLERRPGRAPWQVEGQLRARQQGRRHEHRGTSVSRIPTRPRRRHEGGPRRAEPRRRGGRRCPRLGGWRDRAEERLERGSGLACCRSGRVEHRARMGRAGPTTPYAWRREGAGGTVAGDVGRRVGALASRSSMNS